jgi:hypothetical protein
VHGKSAKFRPLFTKALHQMLKAHQGETNYVIINDNYPLSNAMPKFLNLPGSVNFISAFINNAMSSGM